LILDPRDNIAVCLVDLNEGDLVEQDEFTITVLSRIPRGHKIASSDIAKNDGIIKYGERMGHAVAPIARGEHVHTHNILGDRLSSEQV
jgi:altronate hydrolase